MSVVDEAKLGYLDFFHVRIGYATIATLRK